MTTTDKQADAAPAKRRDADSAKPGRAAANAPVVDSVIAAVLDQAAALNARFQFKEADELLEKSLAANPGNFDILSQYARLAAHRGDIYEAARRGDALRQQFPRHPLGYRIEIKALQTGARFDEAEKVIAAAAAQYPRQSWPLAAAVSLAIDRSAFTDAERLLNELITKFPAEPANWLEMATFLRRNGRVEAAETLLAKAVDQFSDNYKIQEAFARAADELKKPAEAEARWSKVRDLFADNPAAHLGYALTPAAAAVLEVDAAAVRAAGRDEAMARLQKTMQQFPGFVDAQLAYSGMLTQSRRQDEAHAFIEEQLASAPGEARLALELAKIKQLRDGAAAAADFLTKYASQHPNSHQIYSELTYMLGRAGRTDAAEAVCTFAIKRFRTRPHLHAAYANVAMWREDWPEALKRWIEAARWSPGAYATRLGIATVQSFLAEQLQEHNQLPPTVAAIGAESQNPVAELMLRFESLGGIEQGWGCEFGIVQRRFGAEPVGLMRWTGMSANRLVEALQAQFEGVGTPEQTIIVPAGERFGHAVKDTRFDMITHNLATSPDPASPKMLEQNCRRLRFLRRKFLEDLASPAKIFVYKPNPAVEFSIVEALHNAMRQYGENILLYVCPAEGSHAAGTVEIVKPGLFVGYISEPAAATTSTRIPNFANWLQICWQAHRLTTTEADTHTS